MQFIYPIGFLALASILLPILIHLWNVKQGKTLKIGSIVFLGESAKQSSRSFRITDWLLLIIRCLLLILIAFLLAQPFINQQLFRRENKGWVLTKQNQLKSIYQQEQKTIDSLLENGFELHDFNLNFAALTLKDTINNAIEKNAKISNSGLLKQLNGMLPNNFKVYLFAENPLNQQDEVLSNTSLNLNFKPFIAADSILKKVVEAYVTNKDSIKVLVFNSNPRGTNYELISLKDDTKSVALKIDSGFSFAKTKAQQNWVRVNTSTFQIAIYDEQKNDSKYLEAAIKSISDFTQRKIQLQYLKKREVLPLQTDLLFWLSEQAIPKNIKLKKGANLFTYQTGKEEFVSSLLKINAKQTEIELWKRIPFQKQNVRSVWTDGYGEPILTLKKENEGYHFQFYSRFNPQWTNLVWKEEFVKILMPILEIKPIDNRNYGFEADSDDKRVLNKEQNLFQQVATKQAGLNLSIQKPVHHWFWFAAFLLLFTERVLSYFKRKN
jgi:hypothetical protein